MDNRPQHGEGSDFDSMKTLTSTTKMLAERGFTTQFQAHTQALESLETHKHFSPENVKIVDFYRFEGESNPDDSAVIYAIETNTGEKGTLTDAYGAYQDNRVSDFIQQVEEIQKQSTGQRDS